MFKNHKKIKQIKRLFKKKLMGCQMDKRETNSDYEMEKKDNLQIFTFKKILRQLFFLELYRISILMYKLT